jgi:dihydrofolate reductase
MLLWGYMRTIIVAYDKNMGIGANNDLLWLRDLPADLKHFKDVTTGKAIIMGRRTFESIGRPLPNRQNIVVSSTMAPVEGIEVVSNLEFAFDIAKGGDAFIIGGAQLYEAALQTADEILATEVDETFPNATVFFPKIDAELWMENLREHHDADEANKYAFDFVRYTRL